MFKAIKRWRRNRADNRQYNILRPESEGGSPSPEARFWRAGWAEGIMVAIVVLIIILAFTKY